MVIYAATVIVSACLLFLVQPLIAKIILPWFGGSSAVWSAVLVFFQACLLCGYAYAHGLITRVPQRMQRLIHGALLVIGCALMPIIPAETWHPAAADEPTTRILLLLTATVGLPCMLLSSTSPLVQVWYMGRYGNGIPFWLFALSNAGSLVALLSFPLLLEPSLDSTALAVGWSILFAGFAALCLGVMWMSFRNNRRPEPLQPDSSDPAPDLKRMSLWVLLSACGSALLVSVSAQLSMEVAPVPLLWVVPLALYLLSFILNFSARRIYNRRLFFPVVAAALGCMAWLYTHSDEHVGIQYAIPLYLACLFTLCMACHGELLHFGPAARFLTRFYLLIALGGALGGIFVGVIAPFVFGTYVELPLLLLVIAEMMIVLQWRRRGAGRMLWPLRVAMIVGLVVLADSLISAERRIREENLLVSRSFYGVLSVRDHVGQYARRSLIHGTIEHGYQYTTDQHRDVVGSYFSEKSGVGRALQAWQSQGAIRLGVIGLGAGVLASYARDSDYLQLYEINPDVVGIANEYFSFLSAARNRGADVDISLGDARLVLEQQRPQNFDVLAVDAFSSDAIPTHLLTSEAVELYFRHLKPGGVLAVHISNRYLNLAPVCQRAAEHVGRRAILLRDSGSSLSHASDWVLITSNRKFFRR